MIPSATKFPLCIESKQFHYDQDDGAKNIKSDAFITFSEKLFHFLNKRIMEGKGTCTQQKRKKVNNLQVFSFLILSGDMLVNWVPNRN